MNKIYNVTDLLAKMQLGFLDDKFNDRLADYDVWTDGRFVERGDRYEMVAEFNVGDPAYQYRFRVVGAQNLCATVTFPIARRGTTGVMWPVSDAMIIRGDSERVLEKNGMLSGTAPMRTTTAPKRRITYEFHFAEIGGHTYVKEIHASMSKADGDQLFDRLMLYNVQTSSPTLGH